jgi:glucuronoxylan 4-O-methyltransferase
MPAFRLRKIDFIRSIIIFVCLFSAMHLEALPPKLKKRIENLVSKNPWQLSVNEYTAVAETILEKAPCNVLVFGVGRDSTLWMDCNRGGKTVFLEDNAFWLNEMQSSIPNLIAYQVEYNTKRSDWPTLLNKPDQLYMDLPADVLQTKWDVIFVDGPMGFADDKPGRMKSIYMASLMAKQQPPTDVFVHDCNRVVEYTYCDKFLKNKNLVDEIRKLRHYYIK